MAETKDTGLKLHRLQQYVITVLMAFSTFMLADMWGTWKEHLKEDKETSKLVDKHEILIKEHGSDINVLTGRVDVLSEKTVKK